MNDTANASKSNLRRILVAGDVCLDVVGVPQPPQGDSECASEENWRLTGEVRTHLLPGGAMLLGEFVRNAIHAGLITDAIREAVEGKKDEEDIRRATADARRNCAPPTPQIVRGPMAIRPDALVAPKGGKAELNTAELLEIAERLTRQDIIHSLLAVEPFAVTPSEKKQKVLRVGKCHGFSGPDSKDSDPSLKIVYPVGEPAVVVVLDDTGNRFRKRDTANAWPKEIVEPGAQKPLVVYKLHRPLPSAICPNPLWELISQQYTQNRVVVVAVEDLRKAGAPISLGLSWERTALDVVWHLMNNEAFAQIRECPRLVVRLGLEGAVVWHRRTIPPMTEAEKKEAQKKAEESGKKTYEPRPEWDHNAWLFYDPAGIEGNLTAATPGSMVGCGSAFTAAMAARLATLPDAAFETLRKGGPVWERRNEESSTEIQHQFMDAVEAGLHASRLILARGFGNPKKNPIYPKTEIFEPADGDVKYARHAIPIIPDVTTPDREYWRLLESLFENRSALLHTAVANVAVGKRVKSEPLPWKKVELTNLDKMNEEERRKKDAAHAAWLLEAAPKASYGKLSTYDRREIEQYRSLYTLLRDYLQNPNPERPLSFAVFGPPGAGKSFGVKEVAASLKGQIGCKDVESITFNLSLYQSADDLAAAFHLVRDKALEGKVPLVFFDEFDTALSGKDLGWLRCFLAPMQDGKFLDRGSEHPIGAAIFVFAGGTCGTFKEFAARGKEKPDEFKGAKGPDFLSRLRATLDIPSLNLPIAAEPELEDGVNPKSCLIQPPGSFNPYGPMEDFPSTPSILLRRANILAFNLKKKAPGLERADGSLYVDAAILRAFLLLPEFNHGNRSFEAILDMSHLAGADQFTPALLPASAQLPLHVNAEYFLQLLAVEFPLSAHQREELGKDIHASYISQRMAGPPSAPDDESLRDWGHLAEYLKESSRQQADDYANKLRSVGLWFRKLRPGHSASPIDPDLLEKKIEALAQKEHDRFVAERRRKGWAAAPSTAKASRDNYRLLHNCLFRWAELDKPTQDLDRVPMRRIPEILAGIGYEVFKP